MRQHEKCCLAPIVPSNAQMIPCHLAPMPPSIFPDKLAPNVPNILRNPPFWSFASFLILYLTTVINKIDCSNDLTFFMTSFISSF